MTRRWPTYHREIPKVAPERDIAASSYGTITVIPAGKSFGFITPDAATELDVFFHFGFISGKEAPVVGARVRYELGEAEPGKAPPARWVEIIGK